LRFYSTDHRNAASRKVAERLRLRHLGWQWTLSFDDFKEGDAFGRALRDHYRGAWTPMPELEVEGGGVGDAMHPEWFFRRFEQWDWWDQQLLPLAAHGPALDLGAGSGRASLWLQEQGVPVTAVDSSRGAVAVCRDRGVTDARLGDLNDPPTDQLWRAVFLLCGNLGLGGTWDGIRRLLRRVAELSAPDAVVVADTVEPRGPAEIGLRIRYKGVATPWWRQHNVPIAAMESLVHETGWRIDRHLVDAPDHAVLLRKS
jgi:SAM-dependent methyltransferase